MKPIPSSQQPINPGGVIDVSWYGWLFQLFQAVNGPFPLRSYLVADLPSASVAGLLIYVSDATTGAIPAFSDGTNWRRVDTRAIVT